MNGKNILLVGTVAVAITLGGGGWSGKASASPASPAHSFPAKEMKQTASGSAPAVEDELLRALGLVSDEEMYNALYDGKTLADIAKDNQKNIGRIIELQIAEMTRQLDKRLASGSLTPEQYKMQRSELPGIITASVYGGRVE